MINDSNLQKKKSKKNSNKIRDQLYYVVAL